MGFFDSISSGISSALGFVKDIPIIGDAVSSLTKGLGGAVADLPGALAGRAMDNYSARDAYERSKEGAAEAFERSQQAYKTRYQSTAEDMRKAGLNPILAATGGFSVGNAPQMVAPQSFAAPGHYMGGSAASAREYATTTKTEAETLRTTQEVDKVLAETENIRQATRESAERILKIREETKVAHQEERNLVQQMFNLEKDFEMKVRQVNKIEREIYLIEKQELQTMEHTKQIEALTGKVAYEKRLLAEQARETKSIADKLTKIADVYNGPAGSVVGAINALTDALNLHGVVGLSPRR